MESILLAFICLIGIGKLIIDFRIISICETNCEIAKDIQANNLEIREHNKVVKITNENLNQAYGRGYQDAMQDDKTKKSRKIQKELDKPQTLRPEGQ